MTNPFPTLKLTPLHIAVIANHEATVLKLLEEGASPSCQDELGNTVLHYAALLPSTHMLELLSSTVDMSAIADVRNRYGGTYQDYRNWIAPPPISPSEPVCLFREKGGSFVYKTAEEFKQLTGAEFITSIVTDAATIMKEWLEPAPEENPIIIQDHLLEQLPSFTEKLSDLFLAQNENPALGLDAYANRDFERGEIMAIYGGEQLANSAADLRYSLGKTTAARKRNAYAPHINDGFPNCGFVCLNRLKGLQQLTFVMAFQPIKKGSRLLADYGSNHLVKRENHLEIGKDELFHWVRTQKGLEAPIQFFADWIKQGGVQDQQKFLTIPETLSKLTYILQPKTLSELVLNNILDPGITLQLLESLDFIVTFIFDVSRAVEILKIWASVLKLLHKKRSSSLQVAIRDFLQDRLVQMPIKAFCTLLALLEKDLRKNTIPSLKKENSSL